MTRTWDRASSGPIAAILIIAMTLAFEGLLFGSTIAEQSYPALIPASFSTCGGGIDGIACYIGTFFLFVANLFIGIFGTAVFIFNLISFNVPGAPWFVRTVVGAGFGLTLGWAIASLFRGGS